MKRVIGAWVVVSASLLAGCAPGPRLQSRGTGIGASATCPAPEDIADLRVLPQDCLAYIPAGSEQTPLVSPEAQERLNDDFRRRFVGPWHRSVPLTGVAKVGEPFERYVKSPGYGQNARPRPPAWAKGLLQSADLGSYPNRCGPQTRGVPAAKYCGGVPYLAFGVPWQRGITIRNSSLREMPTHEPRFDSWDKPGSGYPFDTLQNSAVWVGTPVLVCHAGRGGQWLFVEAPFASGWMPAEDVASVDERFIAAYEKPPLVAILDDGLPLGDWGPQSRGIGFGVPSGGGFLATAHIGAVFPLVGKLPEEIRLLVPRASDEGATTEVVALPKDKAVVMPLALTPANVAKVANRMLGQPYGWGGLYEDRDCSATTRDIFTPFGLWLPRDSVDQAAAGRVVPLKQLPPAEKERTILAQGVPFLTLIRSPGHIMLYVGRHDGRALVLHNTWGVKCVAGVSPAPLGLQFAGETPATQEGLFPIGRCAITTLQPGIELPHIVLPQGDLRNRIESMILLAPAGETK